jgi:hypothetical protein
LFSNLWIGYNLWKTKEKEYYWLIGLEVMKQPVCTSPWAAAPHSHLRWRRTASHSPASPPAPRRWWSFQLRTTTRPHSAVHSFQTAAFI